EQAARQLELAESTIRGRLARARKLLGHRLIRRGLAPTTGLLALGTPIDAAAARLPHATVQSVARAALLFMRSGTAGPRAVSAAAQGIANGVLCTMWLPSLKTIAAAVIAIGLIAAGAVALTATQGTAEAQFQAERAQAETAAVATPTAGSPTASKPTSPLSQDSGNHRPGPAEERGPERRQSVAVDPDLEKRAPGPIV